MGTYTVYGQRTRWMWWLGGGGICFAFFGFMFFAALARSIVHNEIHLPHSSTEKANHLTSANKT